MSTRPLTPAMKTAIQLSQYIPFLFVELEFASGALRLCTAGHDVPWNGFNWIGVGKVGAVEAVLTSVRAVAANPVMMAIWGLIVAALLVIGSLPFFFGLAVVVPVLGHSTWHLYRKVVEPDLSPRQEHPRPQHKRRYAAHFPAALFAGEDKEPPARS